MTEQTAPDILRILTLTAAFGLLVVNVYCLVRGKERKAPAPCVFEIAWALNTLLFYIGYYATDRWALAPDWRTVVSLWVATIWFQGAASVLILRISHMLWIRRSTGRS